MNLNIDIYLLNFMTMTLDYNIILIQLW